MTYLCALSLPQFLIPLLGSLNERIVTAQTGVGVSGDRCFHVLHVPLLVDWFVVVHLMAPHQ